MSKIQKTGSRERLFFSKIPEVIEVPNLIEIQKKSYETFLQMDVPPEKRKSTGLQEVFQQVFPITDFKETICLEFVEYSLGRPKYDVIECQKRDMTYGAPLKIRTRLILREQDEYGNKQIKDIREQDVFIGELPLITDKGTFVINGAERVIVSQLHRSPGVTFTDESGNVGTTGRRFFTANIIPYRGTWLSFEVDTNDILYVRIDRKKRFLATVFIRAFGFAKNEDILSIFYKVEEVDVKKTCIGKISAVDIFDAAAGKAIVESNSEITESVYENLINAKVNKIKVLLFGNREDMTIRNTLKKDSVKTPEEAVIELYKKLRPGDLPTVENAQGLFERMFVNPKRYDLSEVGRYKINKKLKLDVSISCRTLQKEDIIKVLQYLISLKNGIGNVGDIDHLGNRRVRSVGELLKNQIRVGLARMERSIKERLSLQPTENLMPSYLINAKPIMASIKEFFGSSQLSQFMDQTNPLSELTHKRRLSALGPGGLSRERAGFEVRDVHHTHYGRVCPIETPEGPNIGLIVSLSTYARVNEFGFIETPYRKVVNGEVTDEIIYLTADEEDEYIIAQANAELDAKGRFVSPIITARHKGNFPKVSPQEVNFMDVSPKQLVSLATSLIPFLEHDDANRALMGSNMQRQAVPLLSPEAPLVGTGMEYRAARDSGAVILARRDGIVKYVSNEKIIVEINKVSEDDFDSTDIYKIIKFMRSNQDTCINQRPLVNKGDKVKKGQIIADGFSTDKGELALGKNVLVAFMPWRGYNFEDAILLSESLVERDVFTSLHIEEFNLEARDTKLGKEEITRDIPNVSEETLKNLDKEGIIRIGAEISPGDILVGKVTPKGETELSPEEKLLRAIFGEKAGDVMDASLRVAPGTEGTVIDVQVFSRTDRNKKLKQKINIETKAIEDEFNRNIKQIKDRLAKEIKDIAADQELAVDITNAEGNVEIKANRKLSIRLLNGLSFDHLVKVSVSDNKIQDKLKAIIKLRMDKIKELEERRDNEVDKIKKGDELPPGVIKLVKVFVAQKRKISVGDKMAGRHGNKGVVAKILPVEDMPYMADGTPVEIVLNPLGVPSRMNVGQILETHLGWAANALGLYIASPVFDGAKEGEIVEMLKKSNLPETGKTVLYDGHTGDSFDQEVTVGYIYMMKLAHLVDDKIHARSIGPYSLVTQQPLGGKAQFGGQRFGEMEVWAMEAYGASYILQELLTIKSDDVVGRTKIYESIIKGENSLEPGIPESFNVLEKELKSLALNIEKEEEKEDDKEVSFK
ncbi:MAG: DNA-directed RNA polymerase subunit beta [Candidatus Firestonebacteria bacterium]|nr:DNA-directed RNA polymerase subunit beta [Candidatus Firestonebacteria bacterium]